jgi:hypothetical protein
MSDIRRRVFISMLGGAAAAWPLAARVQQMKLPTIGLLGGATAPRHNGPPPLFNDCANSVGSRVRPSRSSIAGWTCRRARRFIEKIRARHGRRRVRILCDQHRRIVAYSVPN